ncbi:MAG TPA: VOC family protein [Acidimicrobiales bacterium]|jgi:catechol 2,3-dioxygenase-like lactoylglutathione lyase family enzyme|nr:VOC family protein [Acidimicrobiales bacterium]
MAFNHVAFATRDLAATHAFYTEVMGFRLAKVVAAPTDTPGGWARHVFYDTNGDDTNGADTVGKGTGGKGMIAFWDLHDEAIGDAFPTDLSRSFGLPPWVNHLAFDAPTLDDLAAHRQRWQEHGHTVAEVDHGFCRSIYITDPNGILVEFCCDVRPLDHADAEEAERLLHADRPPLSDPPAVTVHRPVVRS